MKPTALALAALVAAPAAVSSAPAHAALPEPVRALIEAAIATGDAAQVKTVVTLAKTTNPDDAAEIDAMQAAFAERQAELARQEAARKEAEIRSAGVFENWTGQGEIGAFNSTGNSSNTGVTLGVRLERVGLRWRHKVNALADFQRSAGRTTREQYLFAYEPNFQISDRLFAYALGQYERDKFQGFASRLTASGGLGYRVIDRDDMRLSVKAGPAWRRTSLIPTGVDSSLAGLAGVDYNWKIADKITFTESASAVIQSGNKSFQSLTGLEASINSKLTARLSYAWEHDTDPPAGASKTDTLTRFTLIYGF